ncbi:MULTISPECIES: GAF domain-containing protein [unclassified Rhizobium]|nr:MULTISPECIES: GAF domain-containing protein [unclassified Rhizobium]MBB3318133.1 hypothetical protein [Rhizobium sp. BK181]MBB3544762.1 hypothetical protein [Rhizobium sp. BK399]MCS4096487.1 hypothetical protein [Rhizobium sp. BK176]
MLFAEGAAEQKSSTRTDRQIFMAVHHDHDNYEKLLNGLGGNPPLHFRPCSAARSGALGGTTVAKLKEPLDGAVGQNIDVALQRLKNSRSLGLDLFPALDIAIAITGADMGTLQRFDESTDCLKLVASRGFSSKAESFFSIVRRDTNTTCAAALTRRMRVFVEDVSTSYLFVGTVELDMMSADGIAAVQSTPLISSNGRLWGMLSTHFRKAQVESEFDHAPLDRLALQIADSLEQQKSVVPNQHNNTRSDPGD